MYHEISDYGLIGNMHSLALVSKNGSIDYCCMPHIDSPTVFAALLDDEKGGYFKIQPDQPFESFQHYIEDTNILCCDFNTANGKSRLIDFMHTATDRQTRQNHHVIHRCIENLQGRTVYRLDFYPRPNYAREDVRIKRDGSMFYIDRDDHSYFLNVNEDFDVLEESADGLTLRFIVDSDRNQHVEFIEGTYEKKKNECPLQKNIDFWRDWVNDSDDEIHVMEEYKSLVKRSLLTLKLLLYEPTGAISAAGTTSLPESIGGHRNWDYRFCWIRDSSFTLKCLYSVGYSREAQAYENWLYDVYRRYGSENIRTFYSLGGDLDYKEQELEHLTGYKNSKPVRIGNASYGQLQLDVFGEVMDTAVRVSDQLQQSRNELLPFYRDICEKVIENWQKKDSGIWEMRQHLCHFTHSRMMCWVALDRGIKIAEQYHIECDLDRWKNTKQAIFEEVTQKGFDTELNSFVQCYDRRDVDGSLLLLGLYGFLPMDDPRILGTIDACRQRLQDRGFIRRYITTDDFQSQEGCFLACSFWMIECLALTGRVEEAVEMMQTTLKAANHLGLFSEEYDPEHQMMLGNFPQAYSHIGFINAAKTITRVLHENA